MTAQEVRFVGTTRSKKSAIGVLAFALAVIVGLSACSQRRPVSNYSSLAEREAQNPALREINRVAALPADQFKNHIAGKTALSYMPGHGNQVEYLDAEGGAHLWYPGNQRVLHGRWDVQSTNGASRICFKYGDDTYNPETGTRGGDWKCGNPQQYIFFTVDRMDGDPFSLATATQVPVILAKDATKSYIPSRMPFALPHRTNGKTPLEHLMEDTGIASGS
ncbi:MAG: hypothetical protein NXH87_00315 [Rhodobiaceae bacterium]|nr:hypothetical protein [Rhodobiaceae bacterium]